MSDSNMKHEAKAYPLSTLQEDIWLGQMLHPEIPLYNASASVRIDGTLDVALFERALEYVVAQHDAFRLVLVEGEGVPTQRILERAPVNLTYHDLSEHDDAESRAHQWMLREVAEPLSLYGKPLYGFALLKVAENRYYWLKKYHHLIIDGWVVTLVVQRAAEAYNALLAGQPLSDEPAPSYMDFVMDDRAYVASEQFQRDAAYWKDVYATLPEPVFQRRHGISPAEGSKSYQSELHLDQDFCARMRAFAAEHRTTLNQMILGALYCYFVRVGGRDDWAVGLFSQNRRTPAFKQTVGLFSTIFSAWYRFGTKMTFLELLRAIAEEGARGAPHRRFPLGELGRTIGLSEQDRPRPFDVTMSYMSGTCDAQFGGAPVVFRTLSAGFQEHGLFIYVEDIQAQGDIRLLFDGNGALFGPDDVERLAHRIGLLLGEILRRPDTPIQELPRLTEAERQQVLSQWNDTKADFAEDKCIHELFEEQARRTPDAIAVEHEGRRLSYSELNTRANRLAHVLRAQGVGSDVPVGLCLTRSIEMVAGLLGILKAGGAYVPLDPDYPDERISLMIEDSGVHLVLTQRRLAARPALSRARVFFLDADTHAVTAEGPSQAGVLARGSAEGETRAPEGAHPESAAYIIYTSGSTGRPKGVVVQHRSLVHFTQSFLRRMPLGAQDRVLQFAALSWDTSGEEIYPCLASGGTLVLRTPDMLDAPEAFWARCEAMGITHVDLPTAWWHELVAAMTAGQIRLPGTLRRVLIGGERAAPERVAQWLDRVGRQPELINTYGLTELTAISTSMVLAAAPENAREVPIGMPFPNVRVYVLDRWMQPVPVQTPGELYIGGEGVARGYWGQPALTAERFVPDPFQEGGHGRLYRTGDQARWLPDGTLEYLGRGDTQLKLRGYRIEPAEVESALLRHPGLRQAVVAVREDAPGDQRLVAYVVPQQREHLHSSEVRGFLEQQLPAHLVPQSIVLLEALPLTPNGKVDRRALPAPSRESGRTEHAAPRTPMEQMVADVFAQVLRMDRVGIHDSFFALGGHSLLAVQVISRIRSALGIGLPLQTLFEAPSVEALCQALAASQSALPPHLADPIARVSRGGPLQVSFVQQWMWFLNQMVPGRSVYNIAVALRLRGALNLSALQRALGEIVRRHEALRTTFERRGDALVQVLHEAAEPWPLPVLTVTGESASAVEAEMLRQLRAEAAEPFDVQRGPLIRTVVLRCHEEHHVLSVTVHHIVSDGMSTNVLFRELSALYSAFCAQQGSPLPELKVQLADVAAWQRGYLTDERLQRELSYWKGQLEGCAPLELPLDHPRPPEFSFRGGSVPMRLQPELASKLQRLARQQGATLFMVLLGAWQVLLSRYSRQEEVCTGTPIDNRTRAEMEPLIGFFVNTLALRTRLGGNPTFAEALGRVKRVCLEAYAHANVPFDRVVEALGMPRDLSRNPLYQTMFTLENWTAEKMRLPGLLVSPLAVPNDATQFDLSLRLLEQEDGGLLGGIEYASDLFERSTAERVAGHYARLLEGIAEDPQRAIGELPLLTETERQQLVVAWNQTQAPHPEDRCIHQLFEAQAARTPEAVAVVSGDQQLTYRELNARANQLAHRLRAMGVLPDVLVGLCVERSPEMVVGLLGILKAGGAYVPLDPAYPQDRLAFMLQDTQAPLLLSQARLAERLPPCRAQRLFLDRDWQAIARESEADPACPAAPLDLSYVIYTSGSTGQPKGVAVTHRNLVHSIAARLRVYPEPVRRLLLVSSLAFDISTAQIFWTLCSGGALVLAPESFTGNPDGVTALIAAQRISHLLCVPSLYAFALEQPGAKLELSSLTTVTLGGEPIPTGLVAAHQERAAHAALYNEYGPTEATVWSSVYRITAADDAGRSVPIGRPIPNAELYILDRHLRPVPVGVSGELYIGGAGLARGYLRRPELSAQAFLPNPFAADPGARLYKTGDLGRFLPDGNIAFLGRLDHQVKIRGYRIELGEIEGVLSSHPAVGACAVLAREDAPGDKRLIAYAVPRHGHEANVASLRAHLTAQLPDYMLPSTFLLLEALPLTPNGKVDHRALPAPSPEREREEYLAPRTPVEQVLADAFAKVLRIDRVGIHDNFFALGGRSLLTVQLASLAERAGLSLSLRDIARYPTVAELASKLGQQQPRSCLVPLVEGSQPGAIVILPAVGGHLSAHMVGLAHGVGGSRPVVGLTTPAHAGTGPMPSTMEELCARYTQEILTQVPAGPLALVGFCFGGFPALELSIQLRDAGRDVEQVILLETTAPSVAKLSQQPFDRSIALLRVAGVWGLDVDPATLTRLTEEQAIRHVVVTISDADLARADAESTLRAILDSQEAHHGILNRWSPRIPEVPIHLLRRAESSEGDLPDYGWGAHTALAGIYGLPGDHFGIVRPPHLETTTRVLAELLARPASAEPRPGGPAPAQVHRAVARRP
ncbi:hypothetical protein SOCE26_078670 [Sorangium cellulosum]|uniref:Carrier domain-containing protein n=1 Tax=Sorangium cellulosum TaxID=56 RepID=A0A2L0F4D0_SORCE|nr:non-ribosomal peptide synthetase [Sorangium cellulosum]AUX46361.1 hypothetical protein SOCE26_078670 [Sorangium cellulosum]